MRPLILLSLVLAPCLRAALPATGADSVVIHKVSEEKLAEARREFYRANADTHWNDSLVKFAQFTGTLALAVSNDFGEFPRSPEEAIGVAKPFLARNSGLLGLTPKMLSDLKFTVTEANDGGVRPFGTVIAKLPYTVAMPPNEDVPELSWGFSASLKVEGGKVVDLQVVGEMPSFPRFNAKPTISASDPIIRDQFLGREMFYNEHVVDSEGVAHNERHSDGVITPKNVASEKLTFDYDWQGDDLTLSLAWEIAVRMPHSYTVFRFDAHTGKQTR